MTEVNGAHGNTSSDSSEDSREVMTYELFGIAARELAQRIVNEWKPDVVLSVARGGLFLGGAMGYALDIKATSVLNVEFYTGVDSRLPEPVILHPSPQAVDLSGMKVLIADDVADSGRTLEKVKEWIGAHAEEVRTVVLYEKPKTTFHPDYVWKLTGEWINFPWSTLPPVQPEN